MSKRRAGRSKTRAAGSSQGSSGQTKRLIATVEGRGQKTLHVQAGTHTIYCDEAGYTGNNLLDEAQPYFAYSAVAVEAAEAEAIVTKLVTNRRLQAGELKASNLVKTPRGRETMLLALTAIDGRFAVTAHYKKFALACKFFEYIFEPALQRNNKFFYDVDFHLFVANVLYLHFAVRAGSAEQLMTEFQRLMRARDDAGLRALFTPAAPARAMDAVLAHMVDCAIGYREAINDELDSLRGNDAVGKWVLDLTDASLTTLLSHWGTRREQLDVYCDHSKPLQAGPKIMEAMIGRQDRIYIHFGGRATPLTFNLLRLPQFVDSKTHAGIQLADIVSGAAAFGLKHRDGEGRPLLDAVMPHMTHGNVFPDTDYVKLDRKGPFLNACLLMELSRRAQAGIDPLDGIVHHYAWLDMAFDANPPFPKARRPRLRSRY